MANNFTPVGNELQINLAPNQNFDQFAADVAGLSDGRFFVAFVDDDSDQNVLGQFVNPDGTLAGSNIDIELDAGNQSDPAVAARAGGAAIVVWEDNPSGDIEYSIVSGTGTPGGQQLILDGGLGFLSTPDVATLSDGRSLVVAGGDDLVFRFIDSTGNPTGVQDFLDNAAGFQLDPAVAAFGTTALIVYEDLGGPSTDIHARFFNGSSFAAAEFNIADETGSLFDPDVAALSDGRFVVVWEDGATDDIHARFVSAIGLPIGPAFAISESGGFDFLARVAALPDGGFIVTWTNEGAAVGSEVNADTRSILARRFDSTGAPAGDLFLVNSGDAETDQTDPTVAVSADGHAFIAWGDAAEFAGEDNDPGGIRGHGFLATTDIVNGTSGEDIIRTYSLGETVNGLESDDVIVALGGDDIVFGGAGADQLKGGLGNDQLFGEGGEDFLKGEAGDDLLTGGLGRDVQLGGIGQDTFDFNKTNESRLGANHDVIQGFRRAEDDRIDLKTIDADTTTGGNQAFDLIGAAAFSGTAGELRFAAGLLRGDTNGDGIANFEIKVSGLGAAVNSDFFL